jgi:hypothetical protein
MSPDVFAQKALWENATGRDLEPAHDADILSALAFSESSLFPGLHMLHLFYAFVIHVLTRCSSVASQVRLIERRAKMSPMRHSSWTRRFLPYDTRQLPAISGICYFEARYRSPG